MVKINSNAISSFFSDIGGNIYNTACDTIAQYSMLDHLNSGVLVGLSGGADSVCLLCFLLEYRKRNCLDFNIVAVHINHGIRGEEADRDQQFCKELCELLNVELIIKGYSVPSLAKSNGAGIEETARFVRYYAFNNIISGRSDISTIAVAHNMSDNVETVLFNILRGSGAKGAGGIAPIRDNIVRPFIKTPKSSIDKALTEFGIPFVVDSTNDSIEYTRNYIRHKVVPCLKNITSDPERALTRFSENMRSDEDFISGIASDFLKDREVILNSDLKNLHYSVFVRVISAMAEKKHASISSKIAKDIYQLLDKNNFSYSLIGNSVFVCERGVCSVKSNLGSVLNYCFEINSEVTDLSPLNAEFVISKEKVEKTYSNVYKISIQANLSSVIISGSLYLRPKKDGDTVYYGGMTHKLKKLFCDNKIPHSKRGLIPILCDDKGVVWVPGFGVRDDGISPDDRKDLFVMLGIKSDDEEDRIYSGSEFRK